ncbi:MAG: hypothetical protein QOF02_2124 [Blastocatellia bacterium]|jgi:VWFA-related protein|nr:hypothetical protein [Blastocatellia bacterium]
MFSQLHITARHLSSAVLLCACLCAFPARGQTPAPSPEAQPDEVLRINTELVQTDVMVFDKSGRFVDNLQREQFELRVDGKPQPISFFDRVQTGSANEDAQLAAARGRASPVAGVNQPNVRPLDRGRTILFFLDDLHISAANLTRTRETLLGFLEQGMGQNDWVAILTASGQLGVLQQLTNNHTVLRTAINRLRPREYNVRDGERTPMTEYQALAIERNDRNVFDYFVDQFLREQGLTRMRGATNTAIAKARGLAETSIKTRARFILEQAAAVTKSALSGLGTIVRAAGALQGRKLLFFISDGFLIDERTTATVQELSRLTDTAARSGIVIYTLESRGLVSGVTPANERMAFDTGASLAATDSSAVTATQEPLHTLAANTGGRAMLDANALGPALAQAFEETAHYYLLAWRPVDVEHKGGKFHHIEASVKERPELSVRVRSGFFDEPAAQGAQAESDAAKPKKEKKEKAENSPLIKALRSMYPRTALPISLSAGFINTADAGLLLTASVQVSSEALGFNAPGGLQKTEVALVGVLLDDEGKAVSEFEQQLMVDPSKMTAAQQRQLIYSHRFQVKPGLYQVRVAARESRNKRDGSAYEWIEVADTSGGAFSLGSLFVGELIKQPNADANAAASATPQALLNVDRRFERASRLLYQTYVYNAAHNASAPDVALQVQIFRDDQPVLTVPLRKLPSDGITDLSRIPYEDDFALDQLPAGLYVLQVTAIDRAAKASATQRLRFAIE